ncbi:MAG: hypothetical protein LBN99_00600, partial [Oscillospiraceae bacterium]|nr:hypothetical protein [Oscillospiraceae bacterium]
VHILYQTAEVNDMDNYAYRRTHTAKRRRTRTPATRHPLLICVGVLAFAVAIHYIFPHFSKAVGDKVCAVVDYRSALGALGEGISGERKFTEALAEAWELAFRGTGAAAEDASAPPAMPPPPPEPTATPDITPDIGHAEEGTLADAAIAAFLEAQRDYSDYMIPAGASYDMPI